MSDEKVAEALRSEAPLVLIEAAAGCGKTYQGALYARDLLSTLAGDRLLILTHTNAACDEFAKRTAGAGSLVEIRTIDSLVTRIATAYHVSLGLPEDVAAWTRQQGQAGFRQLGDKVAGLVSRAPEIARALATRYSRVICDEHQDCSEAQNSLVLSLNRAGARIRIFGDPMQAIYAGRGDQRAWQRRWEHLQGAAAIRERLETPHRWRKHNAKDLGDWIQQARKALERGEPIELRGELPVGLRVLRADNQADPRTRNAYRLSRQERRPIDQYINAGQKLLVLSPMNSTVQALRACFARRIPIWEGHTRYGLSKLVVACQRHNGNVSKLGECVIEFVRGVAAGFTESVYAKVLRREIAECCSSKRRGRPERIQEVAGFLLASPDHRGVGKALARLIQLINDDPAFGDIKVDLWRELRDASRLAEHDDADECLAELALRRSFTRVSFPPRAISTVHKAKGLEREHVIIIPCDARHFGDSAEKRRLLYVALSRATKSLAVVVPRESASPLLRI